MRIIRITGLLLVIITMASKTYTQSYMDNIAVKACECLTTISDSVSMERYQMELGLCMIDAASPYKKQLKKDYKIDFDKIDTQGEELGKIIGFKMAGVCPDALLKIATKVNSENNDFETTYSEVMGQIISVDENYFVVFSVKDNKGKVSKFYWLTFIDSDVELPVDYKSLVDKTVKISYVSQEFFDPKIGEYRFFNIIQSLQKIAD